MVRSLLYVFLKFFDKVQIPFKSPSRFMNTSKVTVVSVTETTFPKVKGKEPHGMSRAIIHPTSSCVTESYSKLCCNSSTVMGLTGIEDNGADGDGSSLRNAPAGKDMVEGLQEK